ncbi:LLM class flavin-dependent oxidoreductase [Nocardioides houyundeii]|uniref:LLM class flavin-dependent oxidoreductase n=1 Tax=Nocardioides houyundeii TaxID=2045452 RepID=UPI000C782A50|nr:LLM class flavin-dependent oxidoreductase [Nocardioides houyundeii]
MSPQHRFMLMSLIPHEPGADVSQRYRQLGDTAAFAESLGFDGFGVGERHEPTYLSSSPAVLLGYLAARTSTIRLFTAATTIAMHDPVRAYEDYATVDQLSGGRLELIIGTGLGPTSAKVFGISAEQQTPLTVASYELLRDLWHNRSATYDGGLRPALDGVELSPPPRQPRIPVWHAGLSSRESAARPAAWGERLVSGNLFATIDAVAQHLATYREEWAANGRDAAEVQVGVGVAGVHVAASSQDARRQFRPAFDCQMQQFGQVFGRLPYDDFESYLATSTALVGSPAEVREKFEQLQGRLGHTMTYHHADSPGLDPATWRAGKELFAEHVIAPVPEVASA